MATASIDLIFQMLGSLFSFVLGNVYLGVIVIGWLFSSLITFYLKVRNKG